MGKFSYKQKTIGIEYKYDELYGIFVTFLRDIFNQ